MGDVPPPWSTESRWRPRLRGATGGRNRSSVGAGVWRALVPGWRWGGGASWQLLLGGRRRLSSPFLRFLEDEIHHCRRVSIPVMLLLLHPSGSRAGLEVETMVGVVERARLVAVAAEQESAGLTPWAGGGDREDRGCGARDRGGAGGGCRGGGEGAAAGCRGAEERGGLARRARQVLWRQRGNAAVRPIRHCLVSWGGELA